MTETQPTKTIRIRLDTLLRLYEMKAVVGADANNNMPTLDTVINEAIDAYQRCPPQVSPQSMAVSPISRRLEPQPFALPA